MNSRQLEYVVTLAEEGSFSKAAKKLIISQPSLSQYIQKLEAELSTQLFVRSSPLKLTYEGRIYVESARRILNEENVLKQTIFDIVNDKVGEIVIGAGLFNNTHVLPHIVQKFQQKYPKIKVIMKETVEPMLFEMLDKGDCDVIFTTMQPERDFGNYEIVNLKSEKYYLAVPAQSDPLFEKYDIILKELPENTFPKMDIKIFRNLPFIFIGNKKVPLHIILETLCKKEGIEPISQIECANVAVVLHLVSAGAGVSIVPSTAALFNSSNNIHFYEIKQLHQSRKLDLIYARDRYLPKNVKYFMDMAKNILEYNV